MPIHRSVTSVSYNSPPGPFPSHSRLTRRSLMSAVATAPTSPSAVHEKFSRGPGFVGTLIFIGVLVVGIAYIGWSLSQPEFRASRAFAHRQL